MRLRRSADPTENVLQLVETAVGRLNDIQELNTAHIHELLSVREAHFAELRLAEAARIDAIRAVDVGAVAAAAQVSATQAATLAAQVAQSAEALRNQVAAVAQQNAQGLTAALAPIQKDVADLRKAQYEQAGERTKTADTRLNLGAVLGAISVLLVLVFGVLSLVLVSGR